MDDTTISDQVPAFWRDIKIVRKRHKHSQGFVDAHITGPLPWDDIILHYGEGSALARVVDILESSIKQLNQGDSYDARADLSHANAQG